MEAFRVQSSTVFRSLGLETDNLSTATSVFGWGESLSGYYYLPSLSQSDDVDMCVASLTVGQGISHYIVDLQAPTSASLKTGGNDALFNTAGQLVPLPVTAWYTSYMHNWAPAFRSSLTYSQVVLNSFASTNPLNPTTGFEYREGQFIGANLVYHQQFAFANEKKPAHSFMMGVEYLYGRKTTLNGAVGDDQRVLVAVSVIK